jgi:DNA-directed RNA polymerase subunit RPC12/RpoP
MADFTFNCPHCKQSLEASYDMRGQAVACPTCNGQIHVPQAAPTPPMTPRPLTTRPTAPQQPPAEAIFCPKCGENNRENNFKCTRCGFALHGSPAGQRAVATSSTTYEVMADKVGLVPNIRKKDNIFQAIFTLAFTIVGTIIGLVWQGGLGAGIGTLAGLVVGGLISGVILCVIGLVRK